MEENKSEICVKHCYCLNYPQGYAVQCFCLMICICWPYTLFVQVIKAKTIKTKILCILQFKWHFTKYLTEQEKHKKSIFPFLFVTLVWTIAGAFLSFATSAHAGQEICALLFLPPQHIMISFIQQSCCCLATISTTTTTTTTTTSLWKLDDGEKGFKGGKKQWGKRPGCIQHRQMRLLILLIINNS